MASFFESPFEQPTTDLNESERGWLLIVAAFDLRSLGRLKEAVTTTSAALEIQVEQMDWKLAAASADHLSELRLTLGDVAGALVAGKVAVEHADRGGGTFRRITNRTALADALHQQSALKTAAKLFREAEKLQRKYDPDLPKLHSGRGYRYCDLQFTMGEFEKVRERAIDALEHTRQNEDLLSFALDHLSLGRAELALGNWHAAKTQLDEAVNGLRRAGRVDHLPRGLLVRAAYFRETEAYKKSRHDLDEAMRLATRCGMRLFECDAHLGYARLEIEQGQPDAARVHVTSAEALVTACGYHRRDGEVATLKEKLGL